MRMEDRIDADADPMQPESEAAEAHYVWQYFTVENHTEAKKGGSKNALCMFCDKVFSGCSTARAAAHLLGRPVMSQHKAGIQACVEINKKDDDRRGSLRQARKTVGEAVRVKEHSLAGIKRKQQVLDELATPSPKQKSVESSLTGSQTTGSKEVDAAIASFVYENGISFNVADSPSFGRMIDKSMKFAKQNPLQSYKTPSRKKLSGELLDQACKVRQEWEERIGPDCRSCHPD